MESWTILLLYSAMMIYLSHQPGDLNYHPPFWHFDKVVHFLEYFFFSVLLLWALSALIKTRVLHIMIPVTLLFAISDEIHQSFVPYREASVGDLVADYIGAAAGIVTWYLIRSRTRSAMRR
jgi:VanZ family protein